MPGVTLKEKAYQQLRKLILKGELKPGEFLTERSLETLLQMSRTPIRSALERLEVEGLVNYTPNKGLVVAELSLERVIDFYDIRMALETYVVKKLASRTMLNEQIEWFRNNLDRQKEYLAANDYVKFTECDSEFHRRLAQVYENKEIINAMENLQDKLFQIALKVLRKDASRIQISYEDHVRIFESIMQGNGEEAARLMEQHLEFGKRILIN